MPRISLCFIIAILAVSKAQATPELFGTDEVLKISLSADFKRLEQERDKTAKYPGFLQIGDSKLKVNLGVRGNSRLRKDNCHFSPLKVNFKGKKKVRQTLFRGEGDLKLVVLCKGRKSYEKYLRTEFLIYKALNLLTPLSYRVRWLDVTYSDSGGNAARNRPGFFVERKKNVAKRNNLKAATSATQLVPEQLDPAQAALLDLFQYAIANTDYSLIRGVAPGECCHNAKLLGETVYYPVIYDFDNSGLINASYAFASASLPIKSVTRRLYRGYCRDRTTLEAANNLILKNKQAILDLFANDTVLAKAGKKRAASFLGTSFDWLSNPKKFQRNIVSTCR